MTTFADVVARRLRHDPGRPLVTFYDVGTGERVELSVTTYANWVAKTASLLADGHGLERGQSLRVDLPGHWLGTVFLGAAWTIGLTVTDAADPDGVVCGPAGLSHWAGRSAEVPVLACSLLPLGVRFAEPLPPGVHDVGVEVWSQPDSFAPWDPPGPGEVAVQWDARTLTHEQLWSRAAVGSAPSGGGRLLSTANPASPSGLAAFTEPLGGGGSLVLVCGPASDQDLARIAEAERVTPPGHSP